MGHNSIRVAETYYLDYKQEKINEYAEQANATRTRTLKKISAECGLATSI